MQLYIIKSCKPVSFLLVFTLIFLSWKTDDNSIISVGKQPEVSVDSKGVVRVVFGRNDSIFYSFSADKGNKFSKPSLAAYVPGMHLGATRGPQLASSATYSLVTAIDTSGAIHCFLLNHTNGKWIDKGVVNDKKRLGAGGTDGPRSR